jgi:pentatricopeptide repeat protein
LQLHANEGNFEKVLRVYENIKKNPAELNVSTYILLLKCCSKSHNLKQAIKLFNEMPRMNVTPDVMIYSILLHMCCKNEDLVKGCKVFLLMLQQDLSPSKIIYGELFDLLVRKGRLKDARELFEISKLKNELINTQISYASTMVIDCHGLSHATACLFLADYLDNHPKVLLVKIVTGKGLHSKEGPLFQMKDKVKDFIFENYPECLVEDDYYNEGVVWLKRKSGS